MNTIDLPEPGDFRKLQPLPGPVLTLEDELADTKQALQRALKREKRFVDFLNLLWGTMLWNTKGYPEGRQDFTVEQVDAIREQIRDVLVWHDEECKKELRSKAL